MRIVVVTAALAVVGVLAWASEPVRPVPPAARGRLSGAVTTTWGVTHEGTIRWDANENFLDDRIDTGLAVAPPDSSRREFGFSVFGFKLGGGPARPPSRPVSVPFGAIRRLDFEDAVVRATTTDGAELVLVPLGSDLGPGCRGVVVGTAVGVIELACVNVSAVVLGPGGATAGDTDLRLWGTVHAVDGVRRSGWIVWDRDESLATDRLDGDTPDGVTHAVAIGRVRLVERRPASARLVLDDGSELELSGTNDVARGHRGVAVTIPGRGVAEIDWDDVARVEFGEPPADLAPPSFAGARQAIARIVTGDGPGPPGPLVWNDVPRHAFETLDGHHGSFARAVPYEWLAAIEPVAGKDGPAVRLTFLDGGSEILSALDEPVSAVGVSSGPAGDAPIVVSWPAVRRVEFVVE